MTKTTKIAKTAPVAAAKSTKTSKVSKVETVTAAPKVVKTVKATKVETVTPVTKSSKVSAKPVLVASTDTPVKAKKTVKGLARQNIALWVSRPVKLLDGRTGIIRDVADRAKIVKGEVIMQPSILVKTSAGTRGRFLMLKVGSVVEVETTSRKGKVTQTLMQIPAKTKAA